MTADPLRECPTCGRCSKDWAAPLDGKGLQLDRMEDRTAAYREWHFNLGRGCYVADVDQVEWRKMDSGEMEPVATIELTRVNGTKDVPASYLANILTRFTERDFQGIHSIEVARRLGVRCFIVAFRWNLEDFWVYNLSDGRGWWHLDQTTYENWLRNLTPMEEA